MLTLILLALLLIALLVLFTSSRWAERAATALTGGTFVLSLSQFVWPQPEGAWYGLYLAHDTYLFAAVICFISLMIQSYSLRHLDGNRFKRRTFRYFVGLTLTLILFTTTDHLLVMILALGLSNFLLARLITHQRAWEAAQASGRMAWQYLGLSTMVLLLVVAMIYLIQGHLSLARLDESWADPQMLAMIGSLLIVGSLAQSAIFPLHSWLIASANAPTPVSAFMHAGLVNGGALLLYKFSPMIAQLPWGLTAIFLLGALTAILGTTWMLVQSDVKRTLTCSTTGQMGFMIMQCGLGLFPAAIAHMIWHGFFKASLFLSAGSTVKAAKNQSLALQGSQGPLVFLFGLFIGGLGSYCFWRFTRSTGSLETTYLLLLVFCGITGAHASMAILQTKLSLGRALLAATFTLLGSTVYGASVWLVETQLITLPALPLNALHLAIMAIFVLGWLLAIFRLYLPSQWVDKVGAPLYVRALKSSQPNRTTLTLRRSEYRW